jgi:hypothetical protein
MYVELQDSLKNNHSEAQARRLELLRAHVGELKDIAYRLVRMKL